MSYRFVTSKSCADKCEPDGSLSRTPVVKYYQTYCCLYFFSFLFFFFFFFFFFGFFFFTSAWLVIALPEGIHASTLVFWRLLKGTIILLKGCRHLANTTIWVGQANWAGARPTDQHEREATWSFTPCKEK